MRMAADEPIWHHHLGSLTDGNIANRVNIQEDMSMSILSATTLEGTDVKSAAGESLGDIKDLMIDLTSGRVAYAVIDFGGFLGIGNKLFAVPLEALKQDKANKCFTLNTTKEALEKTHGFDQEHWPDFADRGWQTDLHQHYDTTPYWG